jgi:hypothetical protein
MNSARLYFSLNDSEQTKQRKLIKLSDAEKLNSGDHKKGIFWTVNEFVGDSNLQQNCSKLVSWYADVDNKEIPINKILFAAKLYPSMVVKTKSGYHCYWNCNNATMLNYSLLNKRITRCLTNERSVYDVSRILRVPGYYHWKDPANPFRCEIIWQLDVSYSEEQMLWACSKPHPDEIVEVKEQIYENKKQSSGDDFFAWLEKQNQQDLLQQLSGSLFVGGERYSFRSQRNGNSAIYVNGQMTACWIDKNGRIGSHARGGPLVYNWLRYFGYSPAEAVKALKEVFKWKKVI